MTRVEITVLAGRELPRDRLEEFLDWWADHRTSEYYINDGCGIGIVAEVVLDETPANLASQINELYGGNCKVIIHLTPLTKGKEYSYDFRG